MKLHLGCGQIYLKGYVNIDFPPSRNTLFIKSVADKYADITHLCYPKNSIEEIRLHHVFEHFTRPITCALLSAWYLWLKPNGILHIEVPDFYRTAMVIFNPFANNVNKNRATRHLYGSHEAPWAVHCEGYTPKSLSSMIKSYGFQINTIKKNSWKGTYNFHVLAEKKIYTFNVKDLKMITERYLKSFLIDKSEQRIFNIWVEAYKKQLKQTVLV